LLQPLLLSKTLSCHLAQWMVLASLSPLNSFRADERQHARKWENLAEGQNH
jgi:hypothetical protein